MNRSEPHCPCRHHGGGALVVHPVGWLRHGRYGVSPAKGENRQEALLDASGPRRQRQDCGNEPSWGLLCARLRSRPARISEQLIDYQAKERQERAAMNTGALAHKAKVHRTYVEEA